MKKNPPKWFIWLTVIVCSGTLMFFSGSSIKTMITALIFVLPVMFGFLAGKYSKPDDRAKVGFAVFGLFALAELFAFATGIVDLIYKAGRELSVTVSVLSAIVFFGSTIFLVGRWQGWHKQIGPAVKSVIKDIVQEE